MRGTSFQTAPDVLCAEPPHSAEMVIIGGGLDGLRPSRFAQ